MSTMKRVFGFALALAMVLSLIPAQPISVSAQEETQNTETIEATEQTVLLEDTVAGEGTLQYACPHCDGAVATWHPYDADAAEGLSGDGTHFFIPEDGYKHAENQWTVRGDVVVDLRGQTLTGAAGKRLYLIDGTLSVLDSVGGGIMESLADPAGNGGLALIRDSGELILYSGTLTLAEGHAQALKGGLLRMNGGASLVMKGGALCGGDAASGGQSIHADTASIVISGGTIDGGVYTTSNTDIVLSGSPRIGKLEGGLTLGEGKLLTLGAMESDAEIYITGAEGAISETLTDADSYLNCFKPAMPGWAVVNQAGVLTLVNNNKPIDPNDVHTLAAAMDYSNADPATGLVTSYCPVCAMNGDSTEKQWYPLTPATEDNLTTTTTTVTSKALKISDGVHHHYYLSASVDYTQNIGFYYFSGGTKICLNLNGQSLESAYRVFYTETNGTVLNIMGQGRIAGYGNNVTNRGVIDLTRVCNLYGGTVESLTSSAPAIAVRGNSDQSVLNVYAGTTIKAASNSSEAVFLTSSSATKYGAVKIYDATVSGRVYTDHAVAPIEASGACGENVRWTLDGKGKLTISGTGAMADYSDLERAPWYSYRDEILSAEIGQGVTTIGEYAFFGCDDLTTVTISDSVNSIGDAAFHNCYSLTDVAIPNSVTTISNNIFHNCFSLRAIIIPEDVTAIGYFAFTSCSSLTSVIIPEGVTTIGSFAFSNCSSLTSVAIPDGVCVIEYGLFEDCTSLASVTIENSVTTIGERAFANCSGLTDVYYNSSSVRWEQILIQWGNDPLNNATLHTVEPEQTPDGFVYEKTAAGTVSITGYTGTATELEIPATIDGKSVTDIGSAVFANRTGLASVTIPDSVISIGNSAFDGCSNLSSVHIGDNVTAFGDYAFRYCYALTSVTIPARVTAIGEGAFFVCYRLTDVYYTGTPDQWTQISVGEYNDSLTNATLHIGEPAQTPDGIVYENTVAGTVSIVGYTGTATELEIPATIDGKSVTDIVYAAFAKCTALTAVSIPDSVTSIGNSAFYACSNLNSVRIGDGVTAIGKATFSGCRKLTAVTIPDGVTAIGENAFSWCDNLTSVTIPESVTTIGDYAFLFCYSLTEVTIPASVTAIGVAAFAGCRNLRGIRIHSENPAFCSDEYGVLFHKDKTTLLQAPGAISDYVIPDSVTTIEEAAFGWCYALTSVTIPVSVTVIAKEAFHDCGSLTDVYYGGTAQQWAAVTIGSNNEPLTNATVHYDAPVEPTDPITKQPEDQLAAYNATAQFTVEATGVDSYQWQYRRNADSKWQSTKLTGYNTPTLSVVMTSGRNNYQYRCALTMEDGSVIYSEPATLTMDAKVEITGAPADCTALEGSFAPFTVEATDVRSYRWYYRRNEADSWHPTAMKGYVTPSLQVLVLPNREGYQYRCKMTGFDGTINYTEPATLHVTKVILTQPTNIAGVIGETAEFHTDVQNVQAIQWLYRKTPENGWAPTGMEGNKTDTLQVAVTAARKGYQYMAKLTNNDGSILYTNEVTLYLAPIVTTHPEDVTVAAGEVATFTVAADETLTYQWQLSRDGINWSNTSADGNKTETLNVTTKIGNNGYQYRCKLTGAEGSVQYTDAAKLTVTEATAE